MAFCCVTHSISATFYFDGNGDDEIPFYVIRIWVFAADYFVLWCVKYWMAKFRRQLYYFFILFYCEWGDLRNRLATTKASNDKVECCVILSDSLVIYEEREGEREWVTKSVFENKSIWNTFYRFHREQDDASDFSTNIYTVQRAPSPYGRRGIFSI